MKLQIVKIGNSQGIRIPKALLEQTGLEGEVEVEVHDSSLILRPVRQVRQGWEEALAKMATAGDDALPHDAGWVGNQFDDEEWEWS
jgi:antitoxin MazE